MVYTYPRTSHLNDVAASAPPLIRIRGSAGTIKAKVLTPLERNQRRVGMVWGGSS